jgi:ATP-dependent RNA helicase SUPV3L1/SUV3
LNHVAFSALSKFDGRKMRDLAPNELAQIAGRAGRGMSDGTFGVTGDAPSLDEGMAQAIMEHRFTPIQRINWRSHDLNFATVDALLASLDVAPTHERLVKAREAKCLPVPRMWHRFAYCGMCAAFLIFAASAQVNMCS